MQASRVSQIIFPSISLTFPYFGLVNSLHCSNNALTRYNVS